MGVSYFFFANLRMPATAARAAMYSIPQAPPPPELLLELPLELELDEELVGWLVI